LSGKGARKAAYERIVADTFGPRALFPRPGLIVGPHDPTDGSRTGPGGWPSILPACERGASQAQNLTRGEPHQ